jgi:hypothetical protein
MCIQSTAETDRGGGAVDEIKKWSEALAVLASTMGHRRSFAQIGVDREPRRFNRRG